MTFAPFQTWLGAPLRWFADSIAFVVKHAGKWATAVWLFITSVATVVVTWLEEIYNALGSLVDSVNAMVTGETPTEPSGISQVLALTNTFLPIKELIVMVVTLFLLSCTMAIYRLAKSWIPTLS